MPAKKIPQRWKSVIRITSGIVLLAVLLAMVDLGELWSSVQKASPPMLVTAFLLFASQGIPESMRLKTVYSDWCIGYPASFRLFLIGMFFSNFMPGVIGADIYQIQQLHAIKPGLIRPISLSLLLRVSGLLVNLVLALLVIALGTGAAIEALNVEQLGKLVPDHLLFYVVLFFAFLVLLAVSPWGRSRLSRLLDQLGHARKEVLSAVTSLSAGKVSLVLVQGVFVVLLRAASIYVLLLAFDAHAAPTDVLLAVTVTVLALVVPISFAGIGIREISLSAILVASGVEVHDAVAISLLSRLFIWILSVFGGVWFVNQKSRANANKH